jgi:hypothetical protein
MSRAGISRCFSTAAAIVTMLLVSALAVGSAHAAPTYQFDANLSLTGSCAVPHPELDPLPDPGCPDPPHPPSAFSWPRAIAVDKKGNIYVASFGKPSDPSLGRVDVFDSEGFFITELAVPRGPQSLAVDSDGVLYVGSFEAPRLVRYEPTAYGPEPDDVEYGKPPVTLINTHPEADFASVIGLAINKANDHLFAHTGIRVREWGAGAAGNPPLPEPIPNDGSVTGGSQALSIDTAEGRIYAGSPSPDFGSGPVVKVFELAPPHALLQTIDGSTVVPGGEFASADITLAVDESTGHLFVYDGDLSRIDEMTEDGGFVGLIEHGFKVNASMDLEVDNGSESANGALNPDGRNLYVPSHDSGTGHAFAFVPSSECPPEVKEVSFANVTDLEAELRATINPCNLPTEYTFRYTSQADYDLETEKFESAVIAGGGTTQAKDTDVQVNAGASGLTPETQYRFQVVAKSDLGEVKAEGQFNTYPAEPGFPSCPNDPLRVGLSASLPDCRAYELVTPADTNARSPMGLGESIPTVNASPGGDAASFKIEGGSLAGADSTGSLLGDPYLATRTQSGWETSYAGPSGAESETDRPIAVSPDQGFVFWNSGPTGSAAVEGKETSYIHYPDGHSELVGRGSLGSEPRAGGILISEGGDHIIFETGALAVTPAPVPKQLEPNAPPEGTRALYDRTSDGITHVISLLPGEVTPGAGQQAGYEGVSLDGKGVAFSVGGTLYLRYDNQETFEIGDGVTFAGVAEGGNRIFYLEGGTFKRFDALTGEVTAFNSTGTAVPVNVSADGSAVYLVSTSVLTASPNPRGEVAGAGQRNLYFSRAVAEIQFVGTVTQRDVEGEVTPSEIVGGLGLWVRAVGPVGGLPGRYGIDPSRSTPDGSALIFESRANLTGYDPEGKAQIYRYHAVASSLDCISCHPAGAPAAGDASLQTLRQGAFFPEPINSFGLVKNISPDGRRAFFQTRDALVARDSDGLQDIYEWEAQGTGSCTRAAGCVYLISSPHSDRVEYIYAVSESGDDVFFRSADLLTPTDTDETPSIYDARVGGGFPPPPGSSCPIGQGCPEFTPAAPALPIPASQSTGKSGNLPKARGCRKGQRKVKRHGKVRCVKKKGVKGHRKQRRESDTGSKGVKP